MVKVSTRGSRAPRRASASCTDRRRHLPQVLAHRIPAPVLAELLGFGAHTICNAGPDLKVDYAGYVARRT